MFKNKVISSIFEIIKVAFIAALIVVPIRYFLFQPFIVRGASMEPSFFSGDYLIVDQISYRFNDPQRGEVIVFNYPLDKSQRFIKRIIGLPGETIEIRSNEIIINDKEEKTLVDEEYIFPDLSPSEESLVFYLQEDEYLVLGDNRNSSSDSREWGPIKEDDITGRVLVRLFPFNEFSQIKNPLQ